MCLMGSIVDENGLMGEENMAVPVQQQAKVSCHKPCFVFCPV